MATKYFALLTNIGAAKLANATALGAQVEITHMAVGDGNGALPTPNPAQTALTHELRRAQLNMLTIDPVNTNQIIAEQVIPEDVGGWWIREIGLFDKDGDMIAVANCAETYKPQLQEGSGRVQVIRVILIVSSTEAVTLKIDPSVVLATRKYVDDAIIEVKAYVDQKLAEHVAAADPHKQYLKIASSLKEITDAGANAVASARANLGLDTGATMPAASGLNSNAGYLSVPALINGIRGNMIIQWRMVPVPQSTDGNMVIVDSTWPVAFPNACLSINPSLTNSLIYTSSGSPFTSANIIDRNSFKAACAYTKSNSTITVWGVGY
ncbi:phage tail protein [Enterobacter cancerogenus]|uniref:phage tail protein n=1 Tax=Enterobacter cancerogenus TaxID=69218 RepID=UPI001F5B219E|nr:phage tail protein [Enterobacter cancerogenus]